MIINDNFNIIYVILLLKTTIKMYKNFTKGLKMKNNRNLKYLTKNTYSKLYMTLELLEIIDTLIDGDRKLYQLVQIIIGNTKYAIKNTDIIMKLISD